MASIKHARQRFEHTLSQSCVADDALVEAVRQAMLAVPREAFLESALQHMAYKDVTVPIGRQQTLSQPSVVGRMSAELWACSAHSRVLEIGTGSGYQSAVLAQLWDQVYTIERIEELLSRAKRVHQQLGIRNLAYRLADGHMGWGDRAPFEAIMVTAQCAEIPKQLLSQLAVGGVIVAPVGDTKQQYLQRVTRMSETQFSVKILAPTVFVPMLSGVE